MQKRFISVARFLVAPALATVMALSPSTARSQPAEAAQARPAPPPAEQPSPPAPPVPPAQAQALPSFQAEVAPPTSPTPPAPPAPNAVASRPAATVLPVRGAACATLEPMRAGFYLRLLTGTGYARFHGTGPTGTVSASGLASHSTVAIGGGIARGLAVAGTVQAAQIESDFNGGPFSSAKVTSNGATTVASGKAKLAQSLLGALVDWYPNPLAGFHAALSIGLGALSLENNADGSKLTGTAVSGSLVAGYDVAISRTWGLGLALVASGITSATMKNSSGDDAGYKINAFSISLAASLLYF